MLKIATKQSFGALSLWARSSQGPLATVRTSFNQVRFQIRHVLCFALGLGILFEVVPGTARLMAQDLDGNRDRFFRSSGCGVANAATGLLTVTTSDGNGTTRTYLLQTPAGYDARRSYPLIFVFHGAGGSSAQSYSWGLQNAPGASKNGIFVFPQGVVFQSYGVGWDDTNRGYDMPFFDNMIYRLESSYCVDTGRVFVAGFSWGGDFSTALACNRGDTIRAIAADSTTDQYNDTSNYLTYQDLPCPSHLHPPVRFVHAVGQDPAYPAPDFATTSKLFQYFNQCGEHSRKYSSSTSVMTCVSYTGCAKELIECFYDPSLGHTLPPNWANDTWGFFSSFHGEPEKLAD